MNEICYWCGSTFERDYRTGEHLHPRELGGNNTALQRALIDAGLATETVPACNTCNSRRGHERRGAWVPYPDWLAMPFKRLCIDQQRALVTRGKYLGHRGARIGYRRPQVAA